MDRASRITVNLEEMASKLGISLTTLREWMRKHPDFPVVAEGRSGIAWQLDPEAVVAFVRSKREEEAEARAARDDQLAQISLPMEDLVPPEERGVSASERLKMAQAMRVEDEVARQRGFLVLTSDMRTKLTEAWVPLNQFLQALPGQIGRRHNLPDGVIRDIRRLIETQQRELHRKLRELLAPDVQPPPDVPEGVSPR
jgi:phage terminase Nu1 subunit (DNA packaging protein)